MPSFCLVFRKSLPSQWAYSQSLSFYFFYFYFFAVILKKAGKRTTSCNQKMRDTGQELVPSAKLYRNEVGERKVGDGADGTLFNHLLLLFCSLFVF